MIFADRTPGKVARSSSARWIGRTLPAIGDDSADAALLAGNDKLRISRNGDGGGNVRLEDEPTGRTSRKQVSAAAAQPSVPLPLVSGLSDAQNDDNPRGQDDTISLLD